MYHGTKSVTFSIDLGQLKAEHAEWLLDVLKSATDRFPGAVLIQGQHAESLTEKVDELDAEVDKTEEACDELREERDQAVKRAKDLAKVASNLKDLITKHRADTGVAIKELLALLDATVEIDGEDI